MEVPKASRFVKRREGGGRAGIIQSCALASKEGRSPDRPGGLETAAL